MAQLTSRPAVTSFNDTDIMPIKQGGGADSDKKATLAQLKTEINTPAPTGFLAPIWPTGAPEITGQAYAGPINLTSALTIIEGDDGTKFYSLADGTVAGQMKSIVRNDPAGKSAANVITMSLGAEAAVVMLGVSPIDPFGPALWTGMWDGSDWLTTALAGNVYTSV